MPSRLHYCTEDRRPGALSPLLFAAVPQHRTCAFRCDRPLTQGLLCTQIAVDDGDLTELRARKARKAEEKVNNQLLYEQRCVSLDPMIVVVAPASAAVWQPFQLKRAEPPEVQARGEQADGRGRPAAGGGAGSARDGGAPEEDRDQQAAGRQPTGGLPPPTHTHTTHTPHTNTTQHQTPTHKHTHTNTRTWSRWSRWLPDRSLQQTPAGVRVLMYMCGMCACVHVLCA